jgi:hypothetical protein
MSDSLIYGERISKPNDTSMNPILKIPRLRSEMGRCEKAEKSLCRETSIKQGKTVTKPSKYMMETMSGCH